MLNHRKSRLKRGLAVGVAGAAALAVAPAAMAAPTGPYADFRYCPYNNPDVSSCIVSDSTSGTIKLGNQSVPINKRIRLQGGFTQDPDTFESVFVPATNGKTLEAPALDVPGGLLGITIPSQVPEPARSALQAAINTGNGVTASTELVGAPVLSNDNLANETGIAADLPVRVKLNNAFLGNNCYIGSAANPVRLRLTTGTTTPPAGTAPLKGTSGTLSNVPPNILKLSGVSLVDNTFAVPRASGCGGFFSPVIDPVVNLKTGLPAAPGKSFARLNGDVRTTDSASVKASDR